jgi:formylglycine-generating enzyme required for sulfatase activity
MKVRTALGMSLLAVLGLVACTSSSADAPEPPGFDLTASAGAGGSSGASDGNGMPGTGTGAGTGPTAARSDDGIKNGTETDVDCGGAGAGVPRCADARACGAATDCTSGVCEPAARTCAAPSATDGVKNADETDVDCGGVLTGAPKCAAGKACAVHGDCATDGCDDTLHCARGRSCTQTNGGRTCGAGEVGQAGAMHESCCEALPIPGSATKLDKYKITAGRMRAFIERTKGDVRGWYDANSASLSVKQKSSIEPFKAYLSSDLESFPYGASYQLGGTAILPALPSTEQGCYVGNAGNPANGSHTYWNGTLEKEDRGFDQAFLDRLPLNCVAYPMIAAFCAWDGGRVETYDEHVAAYGASTYPWGNTPGAGGYASINGVWSLFGPGAALQVSQAACPTCDPGRANWHYGYQFPDGGNVQKPWDYAYWMSAPGRFPTGAGPGGHQDLAGLLLEITSTVTTNDVVTDLAGATSVQPKMKWSKSGSWEGHRIGNTTFELAVMTKYGKAGGRCARD